MIKTIRFLIYTAFILFLITGCSGKGNPSAPDTVDDQSAPLELTEDREVSDYNGSHFPLFHNLIYMNVTDPGNVEYEIVPLREGFFHLNILKFLEVSPCKDCFEITNVTWLEPGRIDVDFKITHPYDDPLYTIFDVRGIMMFDGSHAFPVSGMTIPDQWFGDGEFLNPDGYTSLYNTWLIGLAPPIQEYFQGVFASESLPNATVNGYIRHISDDLSNTRNALLTGDSVTRTYSLKYPVNEFVFGYAVDASWAVPIETPVDDPMTDFGPDANSPEPWKIVITPFMEEMNDEGGITWLQIDVYDWGGKETHDTPLVECPELFDGEKIAGFISETDDFARYHIALHNEKLAQGGYYTCLISVQDNDYNPNFPWIDMKAFQLVDVLVKGLPVAIAEADPTFVDPLETVNFWSYDSYDPDGGEIVLSEWDWDNDGIFDETGAEASHAFEAYGFHYVQCRVTDDEGETGVLDELLKITVVEPGVPFNPVNITPDWLQTKPVGVCVEGDLAYITTMPPNLKIVNISDPYNLKGISDLPLPDVSSILAVSDGYAYIAYGSGLNYRLWKRVLIIDVDPPGQAHIVNDLDLEDRIWTLEVKDGYLFVGQHRYFRIFDVDPPESAYIVQELSMKSYSYWYYISWFNAYWVTDYGYAPGIAFLGDYAYYISVPWGTTMVKIYNPALPALEQESAGFLVGHNLDSLDTYNNLIVFNHDDLVGTWDPVSGPVHWVNLPSDVSAEALWVDQNGIIGSIHHQYHSGYKFYLLDADPIEELHIAYESDQFEFETGDGDNGLACLLTNSSIEVWVTDPPESAFAATKLEFLVDCSEIELSGENAFVATLAGIEVYDIVPLIDFHKIGELPFDNPYLISLTHDLVLEDNLLYLADVDNIFYIIDVSIPETPSILTSLEIPGSRIQNIYISNGYAYLNTRNPKVFLIIDVDPAASASIVNSIDLPSAGRFYAVTNDYAYIITYDSLSVLDVNPAEDAHFVNEIPLEPPFPVINQDSHSVMGTYGNYVYIGARTSGNYPYQNTIGVYDINSPENPVLVHTIDLDIHGHLVDINFAGNYAYITRNVGFDVLDISSPENAFIVSWTPTEVYHNDAAISGDYYYAATDWGLEVYDLW